MKPTDLERLRAWVKDHAATLAPLRARVDDALDGYEPLDEARFDGLEDLEGIVESILADNPLA